MDPASALNPTPPPREARATAPRRPRTPHALGLQPSLTLGLALLGAGCAAPGMHYQGTIIQPEASVSMVTEERGDVGFLRTMGVGVRAHRQSGRWGWGGGTELNFFKTRTLTGGPDWSSAALIGLDGSMLSADGYVRSMTSLGLAILVEGTETDGTELDEPGSVGFFWETRPVVFRFQVRDALLLAFCPLSGAILVPDPTGIPLVDVQFRTNLSVEFL
jgi:hypothetical protein